MKTLFIDNDLNMTLYSCPWKDRLLGIINLGIFIILFSKKLQRVSLAVFHLEANISCGKGASTSANIMLFAVVLYLVYSIIEQHLIPVSTSLFIIIVFEFRIEDGFEHFRCGF